jgi:hypothetical protein
MARVLAACYLVLALGTASAKGPPSTRAGKGLARAQGGDGWASSRQFLGRLDAFEGKVDALAAQVVELKLLLHESTGPDLHPRSAGGLQEDERDSLWVRCLLLVLIFAGACLCASAAHRSQCFQGRRHPGKSAAEDAAAMARGEGIEDFAMRAEAFLRLRQQYFWRKVGHVAGWCSPVPAEQMPPAPVVFLGHPTSLSSAFAQWLPAADKSSKWKEAPWMAALAPLTFLYSVLWMHISPLLCRPYLWVDHFRYNKVVCGVWLSRNFGWRFLANPAAAHRNIKAILRAADASGVKVHAPSSRTADAAALMRLFRALYPKP